MNTNATISRPVTGSPANAQPKIIATTGLMYVYVETSVGAAFRKSHIYALYATIEPNTIKNNNAKSADVVTRAASTFAHSPMTVPTPVSITLPSSIWIAVVINGDFGNASDRANIDPSDQPIIARIENTTPQASVVAASEADCR